MHAAHVLSLQLALNGRRLPHAPCNTRPSLFIRMVALLTCLVIVLTTIPASAFAAPATDSGELTQVRVGYYPGDKRFQLGNADSERKSGYAYEYLLAIAAEAGWSYSYQYGTRQQMIDALIAGKVDLVAGLYQTDELKDAVLFANVDMGLPDDERYVAFAHARDDLKDIFDEAAARITQVSPSLLVDLYRRYYTSAVITAPPSDAELEAIHQAGGLVIGFMDNNAPISSADAMGEPIGVTGDVLAQLTKYIGAPIRTVRFDTVAAMLSAVSAGTIDAAFPVHADAWIAEHQGVYLSNPVMNDNDLVLYNPNSTEDVMNRIAVVQIGLRQKENVRSYYPSATIIDCADWDEAVDILLEQGEKGATGLIASSSILQRLILENPEFDGYSAALLESTQDFVFAINRKKSYLVNIINRAIAQFDQGLVTSAMLRYTSDYSTLTLAQILRRNSVIVVPFLLVLIGMLLLFFYFFQRRVRHYNDEQAKSYAALENALLAADEANSAKTIFLSNMSHDIRTPMNAIIGMTEIAQSQIGDAERTSECLHKIQVSSEHLLALVNDVLDISKIESGAVELTDEPTNIVKLVELIEQINRPLAEAKGQKFMIDLDLEHERVLSDRLRLRQVLGNLVSNAIKYTPDGGQIELLVTEDSHDHLVSTYRFVVADTGIGIAQDYLPHIFEVFSRERTEASPTIQGTGLGLAIADRIVRLMGGSIQVQSKQGVGSVFTVNLTFPTLVKEAESAQPAALVPQEMSPFERAEACDLSAYHALLAEDNEINAEIVQEFLGITGLQITRAKNGKEALSIFESEPEGTFDCIFMDLQMPVMGGLEATERIRKLDRTDAKRVPIFAMTADAFLSDRKNTRKAGMNEHLAKPLNFDEVLNMVELYLVG